MRDWVVVRRLGRKPYVETYDAMRAFIKDRSADSQDELWVLEHEPVYTVGLSVKEAPETIHDIPVVLTDRGGKVTYHGPGQLVFYPLLHLKKHGLSARKLVCVLENTVLLLLQAFDITAHRMDGAPGIYVNGKKIASLGLKIKNGYSYHGLSLNIDMDLTPFSWIDPCGYHGLEMTQLKDFNVDTTMDTVANMLIDSFERTL
jgi:lipoyl(octanoyl) transferase